MSKSLVSVSEDFSIQQKQLLNTQNSKKTDLRSGHQKQSSKFIMIGGAAAQNIEKINNKNTKKMLITYASN